MQVSWFSSTSAARQSLPDKDRAATAAPGKAGDLPAAPAAPPPALAVGGDSAGQVSMAGAGGDPVADHTPAPVYAEIWKGVAKVAVVDIHGKVTSLSGLVSPAGGGLSGTLLAAQRTLEVARQVGGEIRSAGQVLDGQTLLMRARLSRAYAA